MQVILRDRSGIRGKLRKLISKDPARSLPVVGETLVELVRDSFENQADPYGERWQPLSPTTLKLRRQGSGGGGTRILQDNRILRNSINAQPRGTDGVAVGSPLIYAATQQFGRADNRMYGRVSAPIPARPYLPWKAGENSPRLPAAWLKEVVDVLEGHFDL